MRVKAIPVRRQLRGIRDRLHCSQSALAEQLGVCKRTVQRWEAGEFKPTAQHRLSIHKLWRKVIHGTGTP